ncbi:HD domain-containing protein [Patescibacteria group bacterium]|nr:HD domain-containing protein [Patescibacteria group bacterium]MBU1931620.1 HD domain-containing protein [Patescibacteria group bacterium]
MIYQDRIYGQIKITEPVVLELIDSSALQRLKGVDQCGYYEPYASGTAHSRFEHSLGVFILLKKFGADLKEQLAGLIHDVSHGAFSHCIDYALDEGSPKKHDHQDNIFAEFVKQTIIPAILAKYGFKVDYILNEANFPLKERDLPDLCADRIDYSLRTALIFGEVEKKLINGLVDNLSVENKHWVFKDFNQAKAYGQLFLRLNRQHYAGFTSALMFQTVGDFLRYALQRNYIEASDLYTTDKQLLIKAKAWLKSDKKLSLLWERMNNRIKAVHDPKDFDVQVFCKSRIIDPLFKQGKQTQRLSEHLPGWKKVVTQESRPKEYFIRFEK